MSESGTWLFSEPAADRARELMAMLTDPGIRAVVPPWGGETAIDLLPLLDWDRLRTAEPTWFVGFSDVSTLLTPLSHRSTGWDEPCPPRGTRVHPRRGRQLDAVGRRR